MYVVYLLMCMYVVWHVQWDQGQKLCTYVVWLDSMEQKPKIGVLAPFEPFVGSPNVSLGKGLFLAPPPLWLARARSYLFVLAETFHVHLPASLVSTRRRFHIFFSSMVRTNGSIELFYGNETELRTAAGPSRPGVTRAVNQKPRTDCDSFFAHRVET